MNIGARSIGVPGLLAAVVAIMICRPGYGIPAFARKYGLRCSACHEAWPKLNNFGQVFKDNGYQLGNDRDAPMYQDPGYWPVTVRMTPQWHTESTNRMAVDQVPGDATSGLTESKVVTSGFDLSGMDLWFAGTLWNNIAFQVLPSFDSSGSFHFESAWVRFGNLLGSKWLNVKVGKFELDTPVSEKRFLALTQNGGFYQLYHYIPTSDINSFTGIGDNQLGVELMGHSGNSYTRYAASVLSSNSGVPGLPTNRSYDFYGNFNQAFPTAVGLQRVGGYVYRGQSPSYYQTAGGTIIPGTGTGNRPFYRTGAYGIWYLRDFDVSTVYMHGQDNVFLGTGTPYNQPSTLPTGAQSPTWNGGFIEAHYTVTPQFIGIGRYEMFRMSRQAFPVGTVQANGAPLTSDHSDTDAWVGGFRWYPIMNSRAGLALHAEYANVQTRGISPVTGRSVRSQSVMLGFDFAF